MSRAYSRTKDRKQINVSAEDHAKAVELAQIHKLDMGMITGYLYDLALKYDLFSVGWEDRMKATVASVEGMEYLTAENKCVKLSWDEIDWLCVTMRQGRDPLIVKLGDTIQLMNGRCTPCKIQRWAEADEKHEANMERMLGHGFTAQVYADRWATRWESLRERGPHEQMKATYDLEVMRFDGRVKTIKKLREERT